MMQVATTSRVKQHAPIHVQWKTERVIRRAQKNHKKLTESARDKKPQRRADNCKQHALGQQLTHEPPTRRADGQPYRHFVLPRARASEHQVGDVGARDQKDKTRCRQKNPKRPFVLIAELRNSGAGLLGREFQPLITFHLLGCVLGRDGLGEKALGNPFNIRSGLIQSHIASNSTRRREPPSHPVGKNVGSGPKSASAQRKSDVETASHLHSEEARGSHSNHFEGTAVQPDAAADRALAAAEFALPESMTDDDARRRAASNIVACGEDTASNRGHAQCVEKSAADPQTVGVSGLASG
jgi:hypothetical protein